LAADRGDERIEDGGWWRDQYFLGDPCRRKQWSPPPTWAIGAARDASTDAVKQRSR
jgi:hypothetical protein